jgi:hypothetical protein
LHDEAFPEVTNEMRLNALRHLVVAAKAGHAPSIETVELLGARFPGLVQIMNALWEEVERDRAASKSAMDEPPTPASAPDVVTETAMECQSQSATKASGGNGAGNNIQAELSPGRRVTSPQEEDDDSELPFDGGDHAG